MVYWEWGRLLDVGRCLTWLTALDATTARCGLVFVLPLPAEQRRPSHRRCMSCGAAYLIYPTQPLQTICCPYTLASFREATPLPLVAPAVRRSSPLRMATRLLATRLYLTCWVTS